MHRGAVMDKPESNFSKKRNINRYQLAKLHTFEKCAKYLSFTMAAEELCITSSAVSHQINSLEEELGFKLFYRFHRKIELTSDGEKLFYSLQKSFDSINRDIFEIKNQEIIGSLTIYARPSLAQSWLVPKLSGFIKKYPYITLNILTGNEQVNFNHHNIDLAIYYDDLDYDDFCYRDMQCYELMQESIMPVCNPDYAEKYDLYNKPERLDKCLLLHDGQAWGSFEHNYDEWEYWLKFFNLTYDFKKSQSIIFDRSDLALSAAMNGIGVCMGRKLLINSYIRNGQLVAPFEGLERICKQRYYIVTPYINNPKVNTFVNWIKES